MTSEDLKNMNDRSLVTLIRDENTPRYLFEIASTVLCNRYENQIHRNWWILQKQMNNSSIINSLKEEYYSEAWQAFWEAILKVDLSKIENDSWKCVGMVNWYLTNVRTKLIKETMKKGTQKSMSSMDEEDPDNLTIDSDVEKAYWNQGGYKNNPEYTYIEKESENKCKIAVKKCLEKWSSLERDIFYLLEEGLKKVEIAEKLNENPGRVYALVNKMKKDMKKELGIND